MAGDLIWVTGARGFIGSHLLKHLAQKGDEVIGFGREPALVEGCSFYIPGGISPEVLDNALAAHGRPKRIFHLAGGSTVGQSVADPLIDFQSNVVSTAHLLDAMRRNGLDAPVVITSSAAVYGAGHNIPIAIGADIQPFSPYGYHKYMVENLARYYAEYYSLRCTVFRLFSIYGPGIQKQLLFDLCTSLRSDTPKITLGGTGSEVRDWCYVTDAVAAMVGAKEPLAGQLQMYNLGSGVGTCIRDVARGIQQHWGDDRELVFSGIARVGDPFSLVAESYSLPPSFTAEIDIQAGLSRFVEWFKGHPPFGVSL